MSSTSIHYAYSKRQCTYCFLQLPFQRWNWCCYIKFFGFPCPNGLESLAVSACFACNIYFLLHESLQHLFMLLPTYEEGKKRKNSLIWMSSVSLAMSGLIVNCVLHFNWVLGHSLCFLFSKTDNYYMYYIVVSSILPSFSLNECHQ